MFEGIAKSGIIIACFRVVMAILPPPHICRRFNFQYSVSASTPSQSAVYFEIFAECLFMSVYFTNVQDDIRTPAA